MLTRMRVNGFKNLVDVDIPFGPFTCIGGPNGSGKSNLFDAIAFLSALADRTLLDAAQSVRSLVATGGDVRRLFHHVGDQYDQEMSFEVEMIVPPETTDDLGQTARATATYLKYKLVLGHSGEPNSPTGGLEVRHESLQHINRRDAAARLGFATRPDWRASVLSGRRSRAYFLSTEQWDGGDVTIEVHQDKGTGGRNRKLIASQLPRTLLSTASASETPTALAARREMQSWRLLQLEPSSLRSPDDLRSPTRIASNGRYLPATLARLAKARNQQEADIGVYARIANRLSELTDEVRDIRVAIDERRELLSIVVTDHQRTEHEARALSDGTLRFLALSTLVEDPDAQGLLCLEEPENGIHPERISAMLKLLTELAVSTDEPVSPDNPLRQVIVNTHSPGVITIAPQDSIIMVKAESRISAQKRLTLPRFRWLEGTWRDALVKENHIPKGDLLAYLTPPIQSDEKIQRLLDREDIRQMVFSFSHTA